ncbi:uncharacterized protein KGF55_003099 [Candida pseudojiufengensis]|uniref:uncharacterized protein n=1 Tax=Candida pseudojiufengensis TaxID=497109 RepID=UPI00222544C0|nr:uncharacterized protein KGF55_003099 [Candida pseudojiufengensis]KAI5963307.1 hypothetical protein KGF55_003099 [Candida pseudojiufengensis]
MNNSSTNQQKFTVQAKAESTNDSNLQTSPTKSQPQISASMPTTTSNKAPNFKPNGIHPSTVPSNPQPNPSNNLQPKTVNSSPKPIQFSTKPNPTTPNTQTKLNPKLQPQKQPIRQPQAIAPKYTKIQPAIAPKPVPIMPSTSKFNPIPNGKILLSMKSSFTKDTSGGLNTSKRWILPPRPRPGRKPTGNECTEKITKTPTTTVINKRKPKLKTDVVEPPMYQQQQKIVNQPLPVNKSIPINQNVSNVKVNHQIKSVNQTPIKQEERSNTTPEKSITTGAIQATANVEKQTIPSSGTMSKQTVKENTNKDTNLLQQKQQPQKLIPTPNITSATSTTTNNSVVTTPISNKQTPPPPTIKSNDPNVHMMELKMSYLSKLKEQEIIRNYIEVLKNQIKELSFVQNGVITFDALKNNVKMNYTTTNNQSKRLLSNTKSDQLESINNLNDLNKFLNYLSKSSDIIKSVQKQSSNMSTSDSLNYQIDNYVELRNKFKLLNTSNNHTTNPTKKSVERNDGTITPKTIGPIKSSFTPDLLRPLKASNLFNDPNLELMDIELQTETIEESPSTNSKQSQEDLSSINLNTESGKSKNDLNDIDFFVDEHDFLNKLVLEDNKIKEEIELGKVEIYNKNEDNENTGNNQFNEELRNNDNDLLYKKKLKFNCGFCTNDTPCLCFDSDIEISGLR